MNVPLIVLHPADGCERHFTCSLSGFGQEGPQLQDALLFDPDSFLIILMNISPD